MTSIDFDKVYRRLDPVEKDACAYLGTAGDETPHVLDVGFDLYIEDVEGGEALTAYDEAFNAKKIAGFYGNLILGCQMSRDGGDFWTECDAVSAALSRMAQILIDHDLDVDWDGFDILFVEDLTMDTAYACVSNIAQLLSILPECIFDAYHVKPEVICCLDETIDGFVRSDYEAAGFFVCEGSDLCFLFPDADLDD